MPVVIGAGGGNGISIAGVVGAAGSVITSSGTSSSWASAQLFPATTLMLFQQTAAPTGWTKQTTHNDKALRVVSGTASSGGTTVFSTVMASRTPAGTVDNTTLSTTQIPAHNHAYDRINTSSGTLLGTYGGNLQQSRALSSASGDAGGGGAHNHGFTGTAMDFAVQYVDLIIASKD
jgi:hypothetical protein